MKPFGDPKIVMNSETNGNGFSITVASLPDRESLVSEISFNNIQWVEINHEKEETKIQFYPHPNLSC